MSQSSGDVNRKNGFKGNILYLEVVKGTIYRTTLDEVKPIA